MKSFFTLELSLWILSNISYCSVLYETFVLILLINFFSGVKPVDKREGGGSHNWGTFEDEMKAEEDKNNTSADEINNAGGETENKDQEEKEGVPAPKEDEEPKTLTLDEWKAQQGKKEGPKFNVRKAGEGSDMDPKWKKTVIYKKEKPTHDDEEEEVCIYH